MASEEQTAEVPKNHHSLQPALRLQDDRYPVLFWSELGNTEYFCRLTNRVRQISSVQDLRGELINLKQIGKKASATNYKQQLLYLCHGLHTSQWEHL